MKEDSEGRDETQLRPRGHSEEPRPWPLAPGGFRKPHLFRTACDSDFYFRFRCRQRNDGRRGWGLGVRELGIRV